MGLFSVLGIGVRGLAASQLGMDITGQNIANADVEGYSRKRLNITAEYRKDDFYGEMGFGVKVVNIERVRDEFIDEQIRGQNEEVGYFEEIDHTLEATENIFTEPTETGIMHFIDQFFDSWENLANNPADLAARTMVKTNGEILTNVFHNISSELRELRQTRNDEIANKVEEVNELTHEIFNLNKEIAEVEISGQNANDSRDRRDLLLKKLSKIIDINVVENDLGQVTVTTEGNILVSPVDVQELEITTTTYTRPDGTSYSDIGVRFSNSKRPYHPPGGEMKGLYDSRDTFIPEYENWLDTLALGLTQRVNTQHRLGYNLMGYSGFDFFDPTATGASDINISATVLSDVKNIAAALGQSQLPGVTTVTAAGALDFGNIGQLDKTKGALWAPGDPLANKATNIVQGSVVVSVAGTVLTEGVDYSVNYQMGTIQMLHGGYDGNSFTIDFSYNTGQWAGPGDNKNAIEIGKLRHAMTMAPDALGNPTATFDQYYSTFIGRLGFARNEAASNLETREFLIEQYETHQDAIAGVSLDEEMAELIKFQHTYQASARVISTADQMLDVLMNM